MASSPESTSMALFCDFENVALGVRDAQHDKFDIKRVLERLLLKGSIVVKKAYCDWDRYKQFKSTMHEANFELIEIPHVRQSGKNSADIRLVVDALDLCYTKSHVDTFVIISGDSDFSPLVSKLRENNKQVIGVGVKQSTSDLLIANCDEFIFYDDLVREGQRAAARRAAQEPHPSRRPAEGDTRRKEDPEARRAKAIEMAVETLEALGHERGDGGKIRTSVLKDAIKRRRPDFNETYFGFRSFGALLEEAQGKGLLEIVRDEKSNAYVQRGMLATPSSALSLGHEQDRAHHAPMHGADSDPTPPNPPATPANDTPQAQDNAGAHPQQQADDPQMSRGASAPRGRRRRSGHTAGTQARITEAGPATTTDAPPEQSHPEMAHQPTSPTAGHAAMVPLVAIESAPDGPTAPQPPSSDRGSRPRSTTRRRSPRKPPAAGGTSD
jgi:uncharacterized protein (TIGR00288 family)